MRELTGKVAVVTGAASGIGRALAARLLGEGMRVTLADVEADALAHTMEELGGGTGNAIAVVTDVSDAGSVQHLADRTMESFGAVHLLCNNAGVSSFGRSWKIPLSDWEWVLGVNLWGVVHGIRTFMPLLMQQDEGHIVNTSSMVGISTQGGLAPYSVSKHGVVALSEALDLELRDVGAPIGVSVLCPGFVRTRIGESERNRPDGDGRTGIGGAVSRLLDLGSDPAEVADLVVRAIREGSFWVFTHPEMLSAVELRTATMLEGRRPEALDLQPPVPGRTTT